MMHHVIELWRRMRSKANTGGRAQMTTILSVRVSLDWLRYRRDQARKSVKDCRGGAHAKRANQILRDVLSELRELKTKAPRVIRSLERHLKRANSRLLAQMDRQAFDEYMNMWRAHVRWMQLRLVYFWLPRIGPTRRKKDYQSILKELERIARIAIAEEGYEPPDAKELHRLMRLFALSARRGRQGVLTPQYVIEHERGYAAKPCLAEFVLKRLKLKRLLED